MMFVQQVFLWWFVLFIFGLIALPLTTRIFSSFFDKGYSFSKIIGLIITTYLIYFLGTIHVLQFNSFTLIGLVCFLGIASFLFYKNQKKYFQLPQMWKIFLCEEVLFFLSLLFWSYIKGFQPDIHGLEKFMDYGFINSILRTTYFPAKDMWMAPLSINYYYFGHIMTAALVKISFLPSNIAFNLMLATLFALT
ncbi:MAG TPA: DUF2298 domain-containing protein, partial [Patescibacteria group bacterium]|nr:DUF2298 domain-containing protein [Patescibacteria group bacterium]